MTLTHRRRQLLALFQRILLSYLFLSFSLSTYYLALSRPSLYFSPSRREGERKLFSEKSHGYALTYDLSRRNDEA